LRYLGFEDRSPGETAMPTFFIACVSALVTAPVGPIALDDLRHPGSVAFAAGVRL
jgi:hypothetical protein